MIKIKNLPERKMVNPAKMAVGAVGIIRKWGEFDSYLGSVVTKTSRTHLAHVDPAEQAESGGWDTVAILNDDKHLIELFPSGTVIEITVE
jgi:hypothetical protein